MLIYIYLYLSMNLMDTCSNFHTFVNQSVLHDNKITNSRVGLANNSLVLASCSGKIIWLIYTSIFPSPILVTLQVSWVWSQTQETERDAVLFNAQNSTQCAHNQNARPGTNTFLYYKTEGHNN
jgi:hypothetical protein